MIFGQSSCFLGPRQLVDKKSKYVFAVLLGVWVSRKGTKERDYWQKVPRFENVLPNFETPQAVEQSILYKTAEEIVDPVLAQSSGKIPNWLKGKFTSEVHY